MVVIKPNPRVVPPELVILLFQRLDTDEKKTKCKVVEKDTFRRKTWQCDNTGKVDLCFIFNKTSGRCTHLTELSEGTKKWHCENRAGFR